MKSAVVKTIAVLLAFLALQLTVFAAIVPAPPHDAGNGYTCATCHTIQKSLGGTGFNNVCLNCHRPGDPKGGVKPFTPADAADPFGLYTALAPALRYQTSHRWDGSDINPAAGAEPPIQAAMTSNGLRQRTGGQLACVRCHNQHSQEFPPFLRMANDRDQLCLDCHRSRDRRDHTTGTHPVNFTYTSATSKVKTNPAGYYPAPVNANPANPTSAMQLKGGAVLCSTCHGVHYTDSNSATFDTYSSFNNLTPSSGNVLRTDLRGATANSINLCTNCHQGKRAHNKNGQNVQCTDCHGGHVDTGDGSVPNVWLVKRYMTFSSAVRSAKNRPVQFVSVAAKNYKDASGTGVCQACHDVPLSAGYQSFHNVADSTGCNTCHSHAGTLGSFSVDPSSSCNACHGYPPVANVAGPPGYAAGYQNAASFTDESLSGHTAHASTPYQKACENCHLGNSHNTGTFQDVFRSTAGTVAATGGLTPTYDTAAQTCTNVYCHSNANPRGGTMLTRTTPSWRGGKGTIVGQPNECGSCHSRAGDTAPTWSVSHTRHINGYSANTNFTCAACHARTAVGNGAIFATITARALHTNGTKDVTFGGIAGGGSWNAASGSCSNLYCHSNVQGTAGLGSPTAYATGLTWNGPAMTCGSCHAAMVKLANVSTATGSHKLHVQGYPFGCAVCHGSGYTGSSVNVATHVDKSITMAFTAPATANGAAASYYQGNNPPGGGYAACSNVYCHSTVQGSGGVGAPTTYAAPAWGSGPLLCGSCHVNMATSAAATGSHVQHAQRGGYACSTCHNGAGKDPLTGLATAKHANGSIDISFAGNATGTSYSKGTSVTPGIAPYGSCATSRCHGQGTGFTWGGTLWRSGSDDCSTCHSSNAAGAVTASVPFYSTEYPVKQTANTNAKVGAHTSHLTATDSMTNTLACSDCHGSVTLATPTHMSGSTTFSWSALATKNGALTPTYNATTGQCANVYCHGASMPGGDTSGTNRTPTWNVAFLTPTISAAACGSCHGFPPSPASGHPAVTLPASWPLSGSATGVIGATCSCHANINPAGNSYATIFVDRSLHMNASLEVSGGGCDSCHGYPPARPGFKGTLGNWSSARQQNYSGGGGAHTVVNHVSRSARPGEAFTNCDNCHNPADHNTGQANFLPKVRVDQRFRMVTAKQARYTSNRLDGAGHLAGNCSNISCHFGATPVWNQR